MPTTTHGSEFQIEPTAVVAINPISSAIPFLVGAAPVHTIPGYQWSPGGSGYNTVVNVDLLIESYQQFVTGSDQQPGELNALGWSTNFNSFQLCAWADANFIEGSANSAGVVVNVFNPCIHYTAIAPTSYSVVNSIATISVADIIFTSVVVSIGATTYKAGTDYQFSYTDQTNTVGQVAILPGGNIPSNTATLTIGFAVANVAAITDAQVYGGVNSQGIATGLQIVDNVFTDFGIVPGFLNAAGYNHFQTVNQALIAKAANISGCFSCMAVIDIDSSIVTSYPAVPGYKTANNLISPYCILTFPKGALAEKQYWLSTLYMTCAATVDFSNNGAPFESPSNKNIPIDSLILANGNTFTLNLQSANFLNLNGVVTARLFGQSGWVLWGNQTSAFPGSTDPVQEWIPVARMFYWYGGSLVVSTLQFVDKPGVPRQVERLQDSVNLWNNALVAQQALLAGNTTFDPADNPVENLLQGIFTWRSSITPPIPMQVINNLLVYDISGLQNLFQNSGLSTGS